MPLVVLGQCPPPLFRAQGTGRVRPVAPGRCESQREVISKLFLDPKNRSPRRCLVSNRFEPIEETGGEELAGGRHA